MIHLKRTIFMKRLIFAALLSVFSSSSLQAVTSKLNPTPAPEGQKPETGFKVTNLSPGSIFYKAGIRSGDRIIKIGDKELQSATDFLATANTINPDGETKILVVRDGKEIT
ncbi:MAG: PDZ domain-containing protein, partial [Proteobacteria bacterium]